MSHGDVARHGGVDCSGEAEIAQFDIAVLIYQHIARLEVTVHNACGMNVFQASLGDMQC